MEKYKFRIWDKNDGKMLYFDGIFNNKPYTETSSMPQYESIPVNHEVLTMQYTGLKDVNGVEICEGDIIKIIDTLDDYKIVEVKSPNLFECDAFVVYGYEFCSGYFSDNYDKVGLDRFYSSNPEVIGNIHENSELLKKK